MESAANNLMDQSNIPSNLGPKVNSPQAGKEYYFFDGMVSQKYIRGTIEKITKSPIPKFKKRYLVSTDNDLHHFLEFFTPVFDILHRNNVLRNAKTQRSMVKNRGVNRTIRNTLNIAKGKNNAYNRRKDLMQLWENANTSHLNQKKTRRMKN